MLQHAIGINTQTSLALPLRREVRPDVHASGIPPEEERLVSLLRVGHETQRLRGEFVVHRSHPFDVERAGQLDLLRTVRVRPSMKHAARGILLPHLRVFEIVWVLRLLFSVKVVKRTIELAEAVRGGQMFVAVAEVVLSELPCDVALRLEHFGDGDIARKQTFLRARQSNLEQSGTEARLTGDEARAAGSAALLAVPVGEKRAFPSDAINVRR